MKILVTFLFFEGLLGTAAFAQSRLQTQGLETASAAISANFARSQISSEYCIISFDITAKLSLTYPAESVMQGDHVIYQNPGKITPGHMDVRVTYRTNDILKVDTVYRESYQELTSEDWQRTVETQWPKVKETLQSNYRSRFCDSLRGKTRR